MAKTVLTREPATVVAGDTVTWQKTLADYPAGDGWALSYRLINAAGKIDIATTAAGDDHLVSVAAATTAAWPAGTYTWQSAVSKAGERFTVETGSIVVKPDIAAQAGGFDTRTNAKKALDLFEAAILAHGANAWTQEYEIAGRRMKYRSVADFIAMYDRLKADVASEETAERLASGLGGKSKIYVRF